VLARGEPSLPPGSRSAYHALTYGWLVGELVQRVGDQPLGRLLDELLARPLGLDGLYVGVPEEVLPRIARLVPTRLPPSPGPRARQVGGWVEGLLRGLPLPSPRHFVDALAPHGIREFDFSADATVRVPIPAANGHFTARSLARLYAALGAGGELGGTRILSAATLRRAAPAARRGGAPGGPPPPPCGPPCSRAPPTPR